MRNTIKHKRQQSFQISNKAYLPKKLFQPYLFHVKLAECLSDLSQPYYLYANVFNEYYCFTQCYCCNEYYCLKVLDAVLVELCKLWCIEHGGSKFLVLSSKSEYHT